MFLLVAALSPERETAEAFRNVYKSVFNVNPPWGAYTLADMEAFLAQDWSAEIARSEADTLAFIADCEAEEEARRARWEAEEKAAAEAAEDAFLAALERGALRRTYVLPLRQRGL